MNIRTVVTALAVTLAVLLALAAAGFAFYASAGGEGTGEDRRISGARAAAGAQEGAAG